ncbi:Cys-tRNA(Pro) deacylase [candidate division KSB3 bacterium]|uniref:Cys-tRNA(Pro)/Cys-tRNA(Cys) deacylase n=1 Tax=candidate division KSB3 bacterium TaxID=2044937 RepID=A0A2G6KLL7_9BACT|nr:MAG: Cys-tRNA(Pro) deacylase [candidate division KSB3 bacterium]
MSHIKFPVTPAIRLLRAQKILFTPHLYSFEEHGGTQHAARSLEVPEHAIIKTLIFENDARKPFIVLMHGDCEVSLKQLARELGVKRVLPCEIKAAEKYTGYRVGGISPFGTRTALPVHAEASIFSLKRIYINGGKRGFLVEMAPENLQNVFPVIQVHAAISNH